MGTMTEMTRQGGEIQYIRSGERKAGETEEKAQGVLGNAINLSVAEITGISETMVQLLERVELLPGDVQGYHPALAALLTLRGLLGECERLGFPERRLTERACRAEARLYEQVYPERAVGTMMGLPGRKKEREGKPLSMEDFPELTAALMSMGNALNQGGDRN